MILAVLIVLLFISIVSAFFYFYLETCGKVEFEVLNFPTSSVVIAAVGDCSGYNIVKYQEESSDPLASVRNLIEQSDIFLFNMEGVLLPSEYLEFCIQYPNQSCFVSPPGFASYMKAANLTVASLANNHILDGGEIGLEETKAALSENSIYYVGAGSNASEACQPLLLTIKGVKIGFLAYNLFNEVVFSAMENSPGAASFIVCNVTDSIGRLKEKADVVIVVLHWGTSWTQEVTASQRVTADQMHQAGADIVIGHHPHMLQAVKADEKKLAVFSLGNFMLRPDYTMPPNAHNSMIAIIEIDERKVRQCYLYPIRLDADGIPRLPTRAEARIILSNMADLSEPFGTQIEIEKWVGVIHTTTANSVTDVFPFWFNSSQLQQNGCFVDPSTKKRKEDPW